MLQPLKKYTFWFYEKLYPINAMVFGVNKLYYNFKLHFSRDRIENMDTVSLWIYKMFTVSTHTVRLL